MNTRQVAFQLENTASGIFLMQGLFGGAIGGFVALIARSHLESGSNIFWLLSLAPATIYFSCISGVFIATVIWGAHRLTGIRMPAAIRVVVSSLVATLFVAFLKVRFEMRESDLTNWLILALSVGTPVALLVGSRVNPLELFTFGSITVGDDGFNRRAGSRSIPATLGTLPLRFLSIGTTALVLLHIVCEIKPINTFARAVGATGLVGILGVYPLLSAYVTFRSPRKIVLTSLGVVINSPIALTGVFSYKIYLDSPSWVGETPLVLSLFCGSFVIAWLIFLTARLNAKIHPFPSLSVISREPVEGESDVAYQCLGSRFSELERVA